MEYNFASRCPLTSKPFPPHLYYDSGHQPGAIRAGEGTFYPAGAKASDYLGLYAQKYDCVEIDNTFYRIPSAAMVQKWAADTPAHFLFTAKVPRIITHDKVMQDCGEDVRLFLKSISVLGSKLGPLLLQFPYFNKQAFSSRQGFFKKLETVSSTALRRISLGP